MVAAWVRWQGRPGPVALDVDPRVAASAPERGGHAPVTAATPAFDVPTRGNVLAAALNHRSNLAALGAAVDAPPYKAPPRAPILHVRSANTWSAFGAPIALDPDVDAVVAGATLGVVIGRSATRVPVARALDCVAGYVAINDLCVPHASFYRPAIRQRCRDGFCAFGPWVVAAAGIRDPDDLALRVRVDGVVRAETSTRDLVRSVAALIADVSGFLTLAPGDVLLTGVAEGMPLVSLGQRVEVEIDGVGGTSNLLVDEGEMAATFAGRAGAAR